MLNKKILALCDTDKRYTDKLRDLLEERESFPFSVSVYSDFENLKKDVKKGFINAVLLSEGFLEEDTAQSEEFFDDNRIMLMILGSGSVIRGKAPVIRKFRSGEFIRKEILGCFSDYKSCEEKDGKSAGPSPSMAGYRETKVICAYTPVGRCLQTTFSVLLGELMAKKHPVLYINAEPYSGLLGKGEFNQANDITDLIYYMRNNPEKMLLKLESMVVSLSGLDCISPVKTISDLHSINGDDWLSLLSTLRESGLYEYVIIDLSDGVIGLNDILRYGDIIYTVTRPDHMAETKMKIYEDSLKASDYGDILSKTKKLSFPFYQKLPSDPAELTGCEMKGAVLKIIEEDLGIEL